MDEAQWLTCDNVGRMRRHLRSLSGSRWRRWMLFNCACCRRIWALLGKSSRMFIETAERHAESQSLPRPSEIWAWKKKAAGAIYEEFRGDLEFRIHQHAATAAAAIKAESCKTAEEAAIAAAMLAPKAGVLHVRAALCMKSEEQSAQCRIIRDIFGNPFSPVAIASAWLSWNDRVVVRLAQAAYDDRILPAGTLDNTPLLILADALDEAGCTDEQILTHLRSGGEHYRGCWVVDLLLGKQ